MPRSEIVTKKKNRAGVDQFAEFISAVVRAVPRDLDPEVMQFWIESRGQKILPGVLFKALSKMPKGKCFDTSIHFVPNNTDGVKISGADSKLFWLTERVVGEVFLPIESFTLENGWLSCDIFSHFIEAKLSVSTLFGIWELLKKQKNGENGVLSTDISSGNVFLIKVSAEPLLVHIQWRKSGWYGEVFTLDDHHHRLKNGTRVFTGSPYTVLG